MKIKGLHNYQGSLGHQGDVRYGTSSGIRCSCISLVSVSWRFVRSSDLLNKFDLDCIVGKGNQLFTFIGKFRYLGIEDLPQNFSIGNSSVKVELLKSKTGEITAGSHLLSVAKIVNVQQIGTGALLIVNYILDLFWGIDSICLFHSHIKDDNGNLSSSGTEVLLKFDKMHSLENYIQSVYHNAYPLTLCFQVQFAKFHRTVNTKSAIKCLLKRIYCRQSGREV